MLLSFGVTTIRNPGGPAAQNRLYAERVASGALAGPEMIWAGEIIERAPFAIQNLVTLVTPERGAAAIVAEQARTGARYVKLYVGLGEAESRRGHRRRPCRRHAGDRPPLRRELDPRRRARRSTPSSTSSPGSPDLLPAERRAAYRAGGGGARSNSSNGMRRPISTGRRSGR